MEQITAYKSKSGQIFESEKECKIADLEYLLGDKFADIRISNPDTSFINLNDLFEINSFEDLMKFQEVFSLVQKLLQLKHNVVNFFTVEDMEKSFEAGQEQMQDAVECSRSTAMFVDEKNSKMTFKSYMKETFNKEV